MFKFLEIKLSSIAYVYFIVLIIRLKEKKPGDLTDDLRTALGMPVGPNAHKVSFLITSS